MRILIAALALLFVAASLSAQCTTATLSCPAPLSGSLTSSDCSSFDGSSYDLVRFSGTSGTTITIDMHSSAFDTFLGLIDPDGVPVTDNDDISSTTTDSRIIYTLTRSGTWTIMANALKSGAVGDYTLTLSGCPASAARKRAVRP